ncbi:MAG: hypothetical protein NVSMB16_15510 [Acidimicrobiales bacterium]
MPAPMLPRRIVRPGPLPQVHPTSRRAHGALLFAVIGLVGLGLRMVVLHTSLGTLDSDEAVVGLMARHFTTGAFRAFYWGQPYGGTIETGLVSTAFAIFGPSTGALKAVPLALDACAAMLTWRIGRRLTSPGAAVLAGALVWLWPGTYLWWSIKERGFYEAGLCLTLVAALLAVRICAAGRSRTWPEWALLGLVAGLGWWQTPQVVYILVPIGIWLVWHLRARSWRVVIAVPAAAGGAAPWLWSNLSNGFASLRPPPSPVKGSYLDHLVTLAHVGAPMSFGLRIPYALRWLDPVPVSQGLYVIILLVIASGCVRRWPGGALVALVLATFPFLHAILPLAGTVAEGRYTLFVLPWIALAISHRCQRFASGALVSVVAIGLTIVGLCAMRGQTDPYAPDRHIPHSLASLRAGLAAHGITHVWANYWVAYRLTFETGEQVIAAPASSDRYAPYAEVVGADQRTAHVFMSGSHTDAMFKDALDRRHLPYERWNAGSDWVIYRPAAPIGPTDIDNTYP